LPAAELAATLKNEAAIAVVPVIVPVEGAMLDDLAAAMAGSLVNVLRADERTDLVEKPADAEGVEELSFSYRVTPPAGASIAYRFRVLRHGRRAVMAVGLTEDKQTESLAAIEKGLAALRLGEQADGEATNQC